MKPGDITRDIGVGESIYAKEKLKSAILLWECSKQIYNISSKMMGLNKWDFTGVQTQLGWTLLKQPALSWVRSAMAGKKSLKSMIGPIHKSKWKWPQ
jgi:hypothetical protein